MPRAQRPAENAQSRAKEEARPRRSFINDTKDIMTVKGKDDNYVYRWVNDERGRVQRMIEAGYDVVQDEDVKVGDDNVLTTTGNSTSMTVNSVHGTQGILMRIRKEFYEEDRAAQARKIDRSEEALFRDEKQAEGRYGEFGKEKLSK